MRRREFIAGLGSAVLASAVRSPRAAIAQSALPVVGYLSILAPEGTGALQAAAFRDGLQKMGYLEGRSIAIEYRWAEYNWDRLRPFAIELASRNVAAICVNSPAATLAARAATTTIPIVFTVGEDPIKEALVTNLNRPGGNITGFTDFSNQLIEKRLGLLRDTVPAAASLFAILANPTHPDFELETQEAKRTLEFLRLTPYVARASTEREIDDAFEVLARQKVGALIVNTDPFFNGRRERIVALAARHMIPAIYDRREFPAAGGLMSYGADRVETSRQAGIYIGRILNGEKPADLPVQQATKFETVINLKAAKELRLEIPPKILALADEVID
jgi:putative tryptophan/tyrosine transport system substrate-binding protein